MAKSDKYVPCARCGQQRMRVHGPAVITSPAGQVREVDEWHWSRVCGCFEVELVPTWRDVKPASGEPAAGVVIQLPVLPHDGEIPARRAA
ncbi:MAG: hypothetical protein ACTHNU_12845 [Gaiellales bacterium]